MKRSVVTALAGVMLLTVGSVEAAPAQTLLNHVPQAVRESRQMGPVAEIAKLNLAIGLPLRNREELDRLVEQIADPRAANYQQYLSPANSPSVLARLSKITTN